LRGHFKAREREGKGKEGREEGKRKGTKKHSKINVWLWPGGAGRGAEIQHSFRYVRRGYATFFITLPESNLLRFSGDAADEVLKPVDNS